MGCVPSDVWAHSVMATLESTRVSSSTAIAYWRVVPPAPPTSSGNGIPIHPSAAIWATSSYGNDFVRSSSPATGATCSRANSRTVRCSSWVSSSSKKSTIVDYTEPLFGIRTSIRITSPVVPARSSPPRPALKQRYERRQDEFVRQAAREFARRGYDQTTMQELAASMGLATGGLCQYFASKEELLAAICDQLMEPLLARARELTASPGEGERQLRELVRLWVATVAAQRDHWLVW